MSSEQSSEGHSRSNSVWEGSERQRRESKNTSNYWAPAIHLTPCAGFHAMLFLPTRHLLQFVVSPNCCIFGLPKNNHLKEIEVTQWQLNSHEEMSSCHHGTNTPKTLVWLLENMQLNSSLMWEKAVSECWKSQVLSTVDAAVVGMPTINSNSVKRDKEGTVSANP